ncbi:hypothetical protein G9F31_09535 [Acinetobacter sp. 187]|uniref:hypothetical protein n=1 Tax=Acinetobacter lanii TaxID=2715163 RepID=UPI00140E3360|nr:hypothetical protein [Acinetobacter lanii]NHC04011.1 hypothetical protein [Acinetobacter lanii]
MRSTFSALVFTSLCLVSPVHAATSQATEFDQYLKEKKILNDQYKIEDKKQLNEIPKVLSAEDSKTLPLQIDQNSLIEQLELSANQTILKGSITTPDFNQFEKDLGKKDIRKMIEKNLLNNCDVLFEHEYQRVNPYSIAIELKSDHDQYDFKVTQKDCGI